MKSRVELLSANGLIKRPQTTNLARACGNNGKGVSNISLIENTPFWAVEILWMRISLRMGMSTHELQLLIASSIIECLHTTDFGVVFEEWAQFNPQGAVSTLMWLSDPKQRTSASVPPKDTTKYTSILSKMMDILSLVLFIILYTSI